MYDPPPCFLLYRDKRTLKLMYFQKLFYRGRSASELHTHYLDTYLCRYGSVLPPHYIKKRPDGTFEKVPIPLTNPDNCDPVNSGKMVSKFLAAGIRRALCTYICTLTCFCTQTIVIILRHFFAVICSCSQFFALSLLTFYEKLWQICVFLFPTAVVTFFFNSAVFHFPGLIFCVIKAVY